MNNKQIRKQGLDAEKSVSYVLHNLGIEYIVFDNVLIKTKKGTTQIDHIVVSPYGVFVIETKSHKGTIYGDCNSKYWTQCLYSRQGVKKYTFYSPYLQNYGHLRNLYKLLNLSYIYFLGLIVFTDSDINLRNVNCNRVVTLQYLSNMIYSYRKIILSPHEVQKVCQILRNSNIQSNYQDKKHIKYVKSMRSNKVR